MTDKEKKEALNEAFRDRFLVEKAPDFYYRLLKERGLCQIKDWSEMWVLVGRANEDIIRDLTRRGQITTHKGIAQRKAIEGITQKDTKSIPEFVLNRAKQIKILNYLRGLPENHKF